MIYKLEVFCLLACFLFHYRVFAELDVQILEPKWPGECENSASPSQEKYEALVKELCDKKIECAQMELRFKGQLSVEKVSIKAQETFVVGICEEKIKSMELEKKLLRENYDLRVRLIELNSSINSDLQLLKVKSSKLQLLPLTTGYYYISSETQKENWYLAAKFCRSQGLELASVETKEENDELLKAISNTSDYFWLSGTDLGSEGSFYWSTTGEQLGLFRHWSAGQPDNMGGREHCVHFWNGHLWNDSLCEHKFRFICEFVE